MKIPYQLVAAVPAHERWAQMLVALQNGYPRLAPVAIDDTRTLTIACYGPSLKDTYREMLHPIISMSGSLKFLTEHGVVPDYHIVMDPRESAVKDLDPPIDGVHYLMASCCAPSMWKVLKGQEVTLWHGDSGQGTLEWLAQHDPGSMMIYGGSNVGLGAIQVGGALGFRHFEVHGMDGSFKDGDRHAGPHYGHTQNDGHTWDAGGVRYQTSKIMANGVAEALNVLHTYPIFCVFHGDGLLQALVREGNYENACCADEHEKAGRIRTARAIIFQTMWQKLREARRWEWVAEIHELWQEAEKRRAEADFNTGSISQEAGLLLRGITDALNPKVVIEVGTFIGCSTTAMRAGHIYTCDKDNDCLPSSERITTYPKTDSTTMLMDLVAKGIKADMFFFDGRIQPQDIPLILRLSHAKTVYAFDDYVGSEKGVVNVERLTPFLSGHDLVGPETSKTTLAVLVPTDGPTKKQPQPIRMSEFQPA